MESLRQSGPGSRSPMQSCSHQGCTSPPPAPSAKDSKRVSGQEAHTVRRHLCVSWDFFPGKSDWPGNRSQLAQADFECVTVRLKLYQLSKYLIYCKVSTVQQHDNDSGRMFILSSWSMIYWACAETSMTFDLFSPN